MKLLHLGLFSLAALSLCTAAHAQSAEEARLRPAWQALDANHDGKVTLDELPPMMAMALKLHDLDKDGAVSLAEYVDFDLDPNAEGHRPLPANVKVAADLAYADTADPRQTLDIYLPKRPSVGGPLPVIAYIHGGGWSTGSKVLGRALLAKLVDGGRYAAVSIGYRLSWQATWPAQIDDSKAAIRWIRAHARDYNLDPKRICLFGVSSGAHMAVKVGLTGAAATRVQCVIDELGPMDLRNTGAGASNPVVQLLGGASAEKPDLARDASPILDVHAKAPPFLIIAGNKDPFVPYQQSVELDEALRKAGAPVLFQTVDGGGHGDFGRAWPAVEERIRLFLERNFYDHATEVPTDTLSK